MVNIPLIDGYFLTSDRYNVIIAKNEATYTQNISFHSTFEGAIESFFQLKLRMSNARTISGFMEYHKRLVKGLQGALQPLQIEVKVKEELNK